MPEEITNATGLTPTEIWHTGDVRHKAGPRRRQDILHRDNGWELRSPLPVEQPLADHTDWLLKQLQLHISILAGFIAKHYAEVSCAIYYYQGLPEVHFDKPFLQMLGALGVELDVDLYDLRDSRTNSSAETVA